MPTATQREIIIKSGDYAPMAGLLHLTAFTQRDRTIRAVKAWLGFWLLAVLSIPIIVAHWILIPAFLIAGPVVAFRRLKTEANTESATGTCPVHHGEITIELEAGDRPPIWKPCPECNAPLHLIDKPVKDTALDPDQSATA